MKEPLAFLGGQWIPASSAMISVGDAGFVLGVAVAEQLRTFAGKIFRLDDHLERLRHSLEIVGVDPGMALNDLARFREGEAPAEPRIQPVIAASFPARQEPRPPGIKQLNLDQLAQTAEELVAHNHPLLAPGDDLGLSIVITPGSYPTFAPPGPVRPTVCLHTYLLPFHHWAEKYRVGQSLATTGVEQVPARCWPASLKCRSRMHYYLADKEARARDSQARALLLDTQGFVAEASTASLLIYRADEGLIWPPLTKILPGISLSTAAALARGLDIPCSTRDLTPDEVASADEVLLASTSTCLLPVTRFNGRPIAAGRPGKVFSSLLAAWSDLVGIDIAAQAQRFAKRRL